MFELDLTLDGRICAKTDLVAQIDNNWSNWLSCKAAKVMPLSFLDETEEGFAVCTLNSVAVYNVKVADDDGEADKERGNEEKPKALRLDKLLLYTAKSVN